MSDKPPDPPPSIENDKAENVPGADAAAARPKKKKRTWRQRLIIALVVFVAFVLIVRVAIVVVAPRVVARVADAYGLTATFERLEVHFLAGDVGIWHLNATPKQGGGDSVLHVDYARAHIDPWALLRGRIHAYRVEADGIGLTVVRDEEGRVPLFDEFLAQQTKQTQAATQPGMRPEDVDLTAPLQIDALRVQYVKARLKDEFVTPAVDATLELNVRVSDVDSETRPVAYQIDVACAPILEGLRIEGKAKAKGKDLDADMLLTLRGLRPKPAAGYLRPLGIEPRGERIDVTMSGTINTKGVRHDGGAVDEKNKPDALGGTIALKNLKVLADDAEAAGVDAMTIDVAAITEGLIDLAKLSIDGVRAKAGRTADGNLAVAGLELVPPVQATPATSPASKPANDAPAVAVGKVAVAASTKRDPTTAAAASVEQQTAVAMTQPFAPPPFRARLGELSVTNLKAAFGDAAVAPRADLAFAVDRLVVKNIDGDPADPDKALTIEGSFAAPGVAQAITLTGTAKPFSTTAKTARVAVKVDGIKPDAIRPYLDAAGIESQFAGGTLTADVSASFRPSDRGAAWIADATVGKVVLTDGVELLTFGGLKVNGAQLLPDGTIRVDVLEGSGPSVSATRDKEGRIVALGIRTGGAAAPAPAKPETGAAARPAPPAVAATPAAAPAAEAPSGALPRIEIGRIVWGGVKVKMADETVTPTASFDLEDLSVEITDFRTAPDPTGTAKPGKILLSLRAPQLAKKLDVTGSINPSPDGVSFDVKVDGEGIRSADIAPYMAGTGIEPTLKDASLKLAAKMDLKQAQDKTAVSLKVSDFTYTDEGKELVGVDVLDVGGVEYSPTGLTVGSVVLQKPRASLARDADGAFRVAGIRIPMTAAAAAPEVVASPTTAPSGATASAAAPAGAPAAGAPPAPVAAGPAAAPAPAFVANLKKLSIVNGALAWTDRAVSPAVEQVAGADVTLTGFTIGSPDAPPAELKIVATAKPSLDEATITGTVALHPTSQGATLDIVANGIREGVLKPYLPPGLRVALKDGRFRTKIDALLGENPDGGMAAKLQVSALDYRDAGANDPLLALDDFRVKVDRLDLPGHVVALDEIVLAGLDTGVETDAAGVLKSLGLLVGAPVEAAKAGQPVPAEPPAPATPPAVVKAPTTAPSTQPATDVKTLVAAGHAPMPLLTLNTLDLGIKRAFFVNGATPDATPLVLSNLRVRNKQKIELLGDENAPRPPADIETVFAVEPIAKDVKVNLRLTPKGPETEIHVDVAAAGVRGEGLTEAFPALKASLDGAGMTDGRFVTAVDATIKMQRDALIRMDFTKGIVVDPLVVNGVAFKAEPDGRTLLGLEELRGEAIKFDPNTGDLRVKSIELTNPIAHVYNDKDGLHALGLVLKPAPPPTTQPTTAPAAPPSATQPVIAHAPAEANAPAAEIKVDRLTISGLDASYEDRTTDPVTLVPLTGLDLEVRGITTAALTEEIPVTFSATVNAGKVRLPPRQTTGLAKGVMAAFGAGGSKDDDDTDDGQSRYEDRELFAQITADGRLTLYPQPKGWLKTSMSGFEAPGVRGIAKQQGISIGNGLVDNTIDARLPGDGSLTAKVRTILTDLRLKEQPDGPIQKGLKLPIPPDVAIGMLEDPSGAITLPLTVPIKEGELNMGSVTASAAGAAAGVLGTAIASSPVKVVQGGADLVAGLTGATGLSKFLPFLKKTPKPVGPMDAAFLPGDTTVGFVASDGIEEIVRRLKKDSSLVVTLKHRMSPHDVTLASSRANPSTEDAAALAYQLRNRKLQLAGERAALAGRARAELASLPAAAVAPTVDRLRALDRESAETEAALDGIYELLRPGADRAAPRRTRAAAIAIGNARLDAVRAALVLAGVPDAANRVRITSAKFEPEDELADEGGRVVMTTAKGAK